MNAFLLHQLLEETAWKYPDRLAVSYEQESITYFDLNLKSNSLANLLSKVGVRTGEVIGVLLNKSIEAIVAFFAVMKSGGAYIPLDPIFSPGARIDKILTSSKTQYLITDNKWFELTNSAISYKPEHVILVDNLMKPKNSIKRQENVKLFSDKSLYVEYDENLSPEKLIKEPHITDTELAYILYTSGSTGEPKGVMLTHLNAMTFIQWALAKFIPTEIDRFSNHAPLHFDLSVFDIFVSIAAGAHVSLVPVHISANPRALVQWMSQQKISFWYSVPSIWVSIINYAKIDSDQLKHLRYILFAGEVFPPRYLKKLIKKLDHVKFYNLYGPTETNVCSYHQIFSSDELTEKPVPIGRACENTEILVLNKKDEPVAVGETGELLVRGSTVTPGYYRSSEKTREAFRKSPLPHHNGNRFYITGDIVRRCGEDIYEYIGRKDLMVKCSGFRVELQEVEQAFYKLPQVEEAVVSPAVIANRGSIALYAYIKLRSKETASIIEIKHSLTKILPTYMIPEIIEFVKKIPKNENGKIDRQMVNRWPEQRKAG